MPEIKLLYCSIAKLFKSNVTIKQSNNSAIRKGFTLIELLIVITIIGILATFIVASFTSAQAKARDGRRKSDLDAIKKALELYKGDTSGGAYYSSCDVNTLNNDCALTALTATTPDFSNTYIKTFPQDPTTAVGGYLYAPLVGTATCAAAAANCDGFKLTACLENVNDVGGNTLAKPLAGSTGASCPTAVTRIYQVTNP